MQNYNMVSESWCIWLRGRILVVVAAQGWALEEEKEKVEGDHNNVEVRERLDRVYAQLN